jgi:hypothetical protein
MTFLQRETFSTSRLLDFFSEQELTTQCGHARHEWPLVVAKELVDNALDACEDANITPVIDIIVNQDGISISDNGPGLRPDTIKAILDYSVRVSSRAAYVSPTRGAQGNALKTILAMPFVLDRDAGCGVEIISSGMRHAVRCRLDLIRQEPVIEHDETAVFVKSGTSIRVGWPNSASSILEAAKSRFLQIAERFAWLNPHMTLTITWFGEIQRFDASNPAWKKWKASDPTSIHWYNRAQFERLIAACVRHDQDRGNNRTVRDFVSTFRGLSGSSKQKAVLDATGLAREPLSRLINNGGFDDELVKRLREEMQRCSKPVKAAELGSTGQDAFHRRFEGAGCEMQTFQYRKKLSDKAVIETAFAWNADANEQRIILGVNWSAAISNPFRSLVSGSLDGILREQRVSQYEGITVVVHVATPQAQYTDRGKSAVAIDYEAAELIEDAVKGVTNAWAKQIKAEERNASARIRRRDALVRSKKVSIKDAAAIVMRQAYLPEYIEEHSGECRTWNVVYDARGNLTEPHTQRRIPLGTLEIRNYLSQSSDHVVNGATPDVRENGYPTFGPQHRYGDILFIEKEGFMPLFNQVRLAERYDIAIMSTKGMSVTASRELVDELCSRHNARLLVLHDFDKAGFSIVGTLKRDTRRYGFRNSIDVVDLGMRLNDMQGLQSEPANIDFKARNAAKINLAENGATKEEIEFLLDQRVELNAFASDQLIAWIEGKLAAYGVRKVIPDDETLAHAYERAFELAAIQKLIEDMLASGGKKQIVVPPGLRAKIEGRLKTQSAQNWDSVIYELAETAARQS